MISRSLLFFCSPLTYDPKTPRVLTLYFSLKVGIFSLRFFIILSTFFMIKWFHPAFILSTRYGLIDFSVFSIMLQAPHLVVPGYYLIHYRRAGMPSQPLLFHRTAKVQNPHFRCSGMLLYDL